MKFFSHRHRADEKLLYAPWEGPWVWKCECRCGHKWTEPVMNRPLSREQELWQAAHNYVSVTTLGDLDEDSERGEALRKLFLILYPGAEKTLELYRSTLPQKGTHIPYNALNEGKVFIGNRMKEKPSCTEEH